MGTPRQGVGTHFGKRQPEGELSGSPSFLAGGSSHPREPAGGSSSRATPGTSGEIEGSFGFFDGGFESTLAQLVRDEIEQSMRKFTLSTQGAFRRASRRGKRASELRRHLDIDSKSESTDESAESASVDGRARGRTPVERVVPGKIVVNNPLYKAVFDCETYGLANKATRYSRSQARTLGRRKKDVAQSFGVRSEWDWTPALKVFQVLRKFAKACDDNDVSEAEAFYMVQDFTKEPLRTEVMNVMPSRHGGNPGEVSSYLELVNWMLRRHVDEADLAAQAELFNRARQGPMKTSCLSRSACGR